MTGLVTTDVIKWLIGREPEVKRVVEEYAKGNGPSSINVAGPPYEMDLLRRKPGDPVDLPKVTLYMARVKHHLTGELGIHINCSDRDHDELVRWWRLARDNKRKSIINALRPADKH